MMNEAKNNLLAREITEFCKERLKQSATKTGGGKSFLHASLVAVLAIIFSTGPTGDNKRAGW
jgi:hypothetical protein